MAECIFLFIPNLIGYVRILLLLYACWYMSTDPVRAAVSYLLSALLDAFDGHVARLLDQSTKFGAALDMLSDRCTTTCLLFTLGTFYPRYLFFFQISACIDIASHWLHVQSSIQGGSSSHKTISLDGNPLLRIYYTNRVVLFIMCAGNELFYAMLYLLHFAEGSTFFGLGVHLVVLYLSLPIALLKTFISLVHLYVAAVNMAGVDAYQRRNSTSQAINSGQEKVK
ncbi:CDP-diacylglycerol--inositol 3-phosphatidyltransferase [Echinococcus granulosus]|nr:CDP-diacylglycerol--inositol 3-phosphatidyltransferase [Echinococcus granulosus]CDS21523.1 CDP diacylglycerol inositol [Echinococcus granulosus]